MDKYKNLLKNCEKALKKYFRYLFRYHQPWIRSEKEIIKERKYNDLTKTIDEKVPNLNA